MKNKFDEDEMFDKAFDKAARDAFDDFEMPFDPKHWQRLEADLDRRKHKRIPAFWLFKSLEVLVVTSVFSWLVYAALPNTTVLDNSDLAANSQNNNKTTLANTAAAANNTVDNTTNHIAEVGQNQSKANSQYLANAYTINANNNGSKIITNANKTTTNNANNNTNNSAFGLNNNNFGLNNNNFTINKVQAFTAAVSHKGNNANSINNSTNNNSNSNSANANGTNANATNTNISEQNANISEQNANISEQNGAPLWSYPNLATITVEQAAKISQKEPEPDFGLKKAKIIQPYVRQVKLAVLAGADAHSRTDYGRGASGYTFGLVAEGEFNSRFALQAGLAFSSRNYEQERTLLIDNSQNGQEGLTHEVTELRNTRANLLQLPLLLQITAYRNQKWRVYAQTGLSFYLNFSQTYSGSQQTTLAQPNGSVRFSTNIDRNQYDGALFQTRQLKNNVFINAQIGLGVERQLSDNWSLFVQPNFQYSLTKMNSYGNRNHVLSLHVGAKTTF